MRVLQFIPSLDAHDGGTTTYLQQLTPALGSLCELHVCCLFPKVGDPSKIVQLENARIHFIPLPLSQICQMKRAWMQLLDEVKPDVLHVNCCWMPQCALVQRWFVEWRKKTGSRARSFLTPHGMLEPWIIRRNYWTKKWPAIHLYQKKAVRQTDVIMATAVEEKDHLLDLGWNTTIEMIPNGIDVKNIALKTEWRQPRNFLFMSRIHPKKGIDILIDALSWGKTQKSLPEGIQVKIAGEGEPAYRKMLEEKVCAAGIEDLVHFIGPVYGPAKWQLIREADVVVLPSHSENFGLIVAEALSSGTPVITTLGTPWASLQETRSGWWVEAKPQPILQAITEAAALSAKDTEQMGLRGRRLVEERFGVELQARRIYEVYERNLKA